MSHFVFSTLTADQVYTRTAPGGGDMPRVVAQVFIAGGSNLSDKYLRTPIGVMTEVDDEELTVLQENPVFQMHEKNGFIKIEKKKADPEKVAADMITRDQSAPLVDADFADNEKPKTNAKDDEDDKPRAPGGGGNKRRA